jgi:uncharacterized protein (DUF2267 family)
MSYRWFVQEVARRAGVSYGDAERAVTETLRALGQRLADIDARAVAAQLPPSLADAFMSAVEQASPEEAEAALTEAADRRLVRGACRLLAELLDEQARAHLRMQPLQALFV